MLLLTPLLQLLLLLLLLLLLKLLTPLEPLTSCGHAHVRTHVRTRGRTHMHTQVVCKISRYDGKPVDMWAAGVLVVSQSRGFKSTYAFQCLQYKRVVHA